eukprot:GHVQ01033808.1.p1 GENE.GHVQ01033808.1~~GHVQ01033808.1.p1  ORF type:complete len:132 (+),score=19.02 GHVQ01033808.1:70-465(+)
MCVNVCVQVCVWVCDCQCSWCMVACRCYSVEYYKRTHMSRQTPHTSQHKNMKHTQARTSTSALTSTHTNTPTHKHTHNPNSTFTENKHQGAYKATTGTDTRPTHITQGPTVYVQIAAALEAYCTTTWIFIL